ncbi:MAG: helix-turn-helix transcriptional regulator [Clostridiales bacterium]|nr:helix-turn-helix transcriptional regulator [Clostridiales bacterium]
MKLNVIAIKCFMAENGMTNAALAEKSGISRQSVSTILRRKTCNTLNVGKIAKALGVTVQQIIEED